MKRISTAELQMYMAELQKASGLNATQFKPIQQEAKEFSARYWRLKRRDKEKKKTEVEEYELKPSITMDMHLYQLCFLNKGSVVINDGFFRYDKTHGYWVSIRDKDVLKMLAHLSGKSFKWLGSSKARYKKFLGTQNATTSAMKYSRSMLTLTDEDTPESKHLRAFRNCTVDMRTGVSMQHSPGHYLTSAISAEYHANAPCPEVFISFLKASYGEDMIPIIRAAFSMILDPTAPWGKFIHIIGPSGSGKGVMLRLLQKFFGKNAIGTSSFEEISNPDKRHQNLKNCDLYVIGDISGYIKGLETFYDLVDNAPMTGRALQSSDAYSRQWDIRFALASVEYLQLENTAGGWDRRVLPILSQRRPENTDIPNLEYQLEENLSGIISWALAIDKEQRNAILKKPWEFSERISNAMHESKIYGDSVASFVDRCLKPIPFGSKAIEPIVHPGAIHDWYVAYCKAHSLTPKGQPKFISHLKTIIPRHYTPRRRAKPGETKERDKDGKLKKLPAKWSWIQCIPGIFENEEDPITGLTRSGLICRKQSCKEGSLEDFASWKPTRESQDETQKSRLSTGGQGGLSVGAKSESLEPPEAKTGAGGLGGQGKKIDLSSDEIFERF